MIRLVGSLSKLYTKNSKTIPQFYNTIAHYSTKKVDQEFTSQQNIRNTHNIEHAKLIEKYNILNKNIKEVKEQITEIQTNGLNLNIELAKCRKQITQLIEKGDKIRAQTKNKVADIQDGKIVQFAKQLIKFNQKLTSIQTKQRESLSEGLQMTSRILLNTLKKFNFEPYQPLKQKYTPSMPVTLVGDKTVKTGIISEILQAGLMYKKKIITPATVSLK